MNLSWMGRYRWAGGSRRWSRGGLHLFCQTWSWKKHALTKKYTARLFPVLYSLPTTMARPTDKVLASRIALPPDTRISYSLFTPSPTCVYPHDTIELARRSILSRNHASSTILDDLLTSVHIGPEPFIYVFDITAQSLDSLHFDGLAGWSSHWQALPFSAILIQILLTVAERSTFSPPSVSKCVETLAYPVFLFWRLILTGYCLMTTNGIPVVTFLKLFVQE